MQTRTRAHTVEHEVGGVAAGVVVGAVSSHARNCMRRGRAFKQESRGVGVEAGVCDQCSGKEA